MKKDKIEQQAFNLREAAQYIGRSYKHVLELVEANIIPCRIISNGEGVRRTYYFSRKALDDWLEGKDDEQ